MKTRIRWALCISLILYKICWTNEHSDHANTDHDVVIIKAENASGWNRHLGQVCYEWDFLSDDLRTAGANTTGV